MGSGYTFPVEARTLDELRSLSQPNVVEGGQSEALAWILYDTQLYESGVTQELTFFSQSPANRFVGNTTGQGLPTPQYFECYFWGVDVLREPGNTDVLGDTWRILNGVGGAALVGAPTWRFTLADKQMGPFPLRSLHGLGGVTGFTTRTGQEYANNGGLDNTFCSDGAMVIPPTQSFTVNFNWPAPVTLSGDTQLGFWVAGTMHRRVL